MPAIKTDVIPLVVGLSLCGASAALLYIWFHTQETEDECDAATSTAPTVTNRLRRISRQISQTASQFAAQPPASATPQPTLECVIPNHLVPLVEGRAGANVRAIEAQTGCRIQFRVRDAASKICEITGATTAAVQLAADLVRKEAAPAPIVTEVLHVPVSACALIVGRCGEALQEICRRSMAKVYVDPGAGTGSATNGSGCEDGEPTRPIMITGTRPHVQLARTMIEEKLRETEKARQASGAADQQRREPGRGKHAAESATLNGGNGVTGAGRGVADVAPATNDNDSTVQVAAASSQPPLQHCVSVPPVGDSQLEVYVSAIASPSRFWLQLVGPQSQRLDGMVSEMTEYYSAEEARQLHKIADPYLGQIVAALFKYDGKWYRAEIVGILPNEYNPRNVVLDLYFVDFGDSEYVAPHEVYELRTDFLTLRFQAIECFLANVRSTNTKESDVWSPDAISRFEEITHVAQWKKMHARIVTTKERKYGDFVRRESSPVPGVELFDSNDINIASMLLQENFALEEVNTKPHPPPTPPRSPSSASSNDSSPHINGKPRNAPTKTQLERHESFIETEKRQMLNKGNEQAAESADSGL